MRMPLQWTIFRPRGRHLPISGHIDYLLGVAGLKRVCKIDFSKGKLGFIDKMANAKLKYNLLNSVSTLNAHTLMKHDSLKCIPFKIYFNLAYFVSK